MLWNLLIFNVENRQYRPLNYGLAMTYFLAKRGLCSVTYHLG